jgi:hypothetical protein
MVQVSGSGLRFEDSGSRGYHQRLQDDREAVAGMAAGGVPPRFPLRAAHPL